MSAAKPLALISVTDYLAGELVSKAKHEYAGGYVYAMAGATNAHNKIAGAFFAAMHNALRSGPCQPFNTDTKVRVRMATHTRFYYPDGMVVCDENDDADSYQDEPVILAEVMSASTRRVDEGEKRDAYLTIPSLSAYLLIESTRPRVVVHARTDSGFVTHEYDGPDAVVPLDAIGTSMKLADLYERIDFAAAAAEDAVEADEVIG